MNNVKDFYEKNAEKFSDTRFCLWDVVLNFSNKFKKSDYVCDAGCGNGKNIKYLQEKCEIIGFDNCESLVKICLEKGYYVSQRNVLFTEYLSNTFDYVICIAVIHHLDSEEKHITAIHELMRILKKDGELLITMWAYESDIYSAKKKFILGHNYINFGKSSEERYYYIYDKNNLEVMLKKLNYSSRFWWERGNWNIIIKKNK